MVTEGLHGLVAKFFPPGSVYNGVQGGGEDQHPKTLFLLSQSEFFHLPRLIRKTQLPYSKVVLLLGRGPAEQRGQDAGALASVLT